MNEIAGSSRSDIACLNCGDRETRVFEIDCGDWAVQCDSCGAIGPAHATSPQQARQWFRPSPMAQSALSLLRRETESRIRLLQAADWEVENLRLSNELADLRRLVARMVDYLPRGSDLHQEAQNATVDGKKCPNSETGGEARERQCRDC